MEQEEISRALMTVMGQLSPSQRVAFVLHEAFGLPFSEIAEVLQTSVQSAKKQASRARRRLCPTEEGTLPAQELGTHLQLVEAFFEAARHGDLRRLVRLLAPGGRPVLLVSFGFDSRDRIGRISITPYSQESLSLSGQSGFPARRPPG